jgi:hypothetical protein
MLNALAHLLGTVKFVFTALSSVKLVFLATKVNTEYLVFFVIPNFGNAVSVQFHFLDNGTRM